MKKISIIIPAYNEEDAIEEVIRRVKFISSPNDEILVIDDGSKDNTYKLAKKTKVKIIKHKVNKGKAFALKTGFNAAKNDIVATIDADCTYPPEEIKKLLKEIENADIVIGSRFMNGIPKEIPLYRGLANKIGALITTILAWKRVTDVTTGLRIFNKNILNTCEIKARGLDFEAEFTMRAIKKNYKYKEVPIRIEERKGASKLNFSRDCLLFFVAVLRGRFT